MNEQGKNRKERTGTNRGSLGTETQKSKIEAQNRRKSTRRKYKGRGKPKINQ